MTALQADLFPTDAPAVPQLKAHYPIRWISWDYITSPTRGQMRRMIGEILRGPCAGVVVWKPLTMTFEGCRWVEQALKKTAKSTRQAELLLTQLRRPGLGEYLDNLCRALVERGEMLAVLYPYEHVPTQQTFWTVDRVKRIT